MSQFVRVKAAVWVLTAIQRSASLSGEQSYVRSLDC